MADLTTGTRHEHPAPYDQTAPHDHAAPGAPPVSARTAHVVLIGAPSPLRAAAARQLRASNALLACLDTPADLLPALTSPAISARNGLSGATLVFVTVPRTPGLTTRLRHKFRAAALTVGMDQAVATAHGHGASRVIALSTVFCYGGEGGPETARSAAAEHAARLFTGLGGDSVVLRLGWTCGPGEPITRRVLSAARLGWRLIDGDPAAWVAMISEADAASAVLPALTVPPGIYNVTDGAPITQDMLNTTLETTLGQPLHSLHEPGWGRDGTLFGFSRRIADARFGDLTGWRPRVAPVAENLADLL